MAVDSDGDPYLRDTTAYLRDAVELLLLHRPEQPLAFMDEYFDAVLRGRHVVGRDFAFVSATARNRIAFVAAFRTTFDACCWVNQRNDGSDTSGTGGVEAAAPGATASGVGPGVGPGGLGADSNATVHVGGASGITQAGRGFDFDDWRAGCSRSRATVWEENSRS